MHAGRHSLRAGQGVLSLKKKLLEFAKYVFPVLVEKWLAGRVKK